MFCLDEYLLTTEDRVRLKLCLGLAAESVMIAKCLFHWIHSLLEHFFLFVAVLLPFSIPP